MAGTRGAHRGGSSSSHAEASEQEPRQRPTASVRRRGKGRHRESGPSSHGEAGSSTGHGEAGPSLPTPTDIHEEQENIIHHEKVVARQDHDVLGGFPGGPEDTSLLTEFADHVACAIWDDQTGPCRPMRTCRLTTLVRLDGLSHNCHP
ncbi:uncharacterized protein LOC114186106 isoform X2 [Vigna unguiculata]|uniref:uncharacterized protein LOC114186106 isoform X2 n=1 Tax=Vigna unguiculata TaxID=3917 RepID=UPI0010164600|nr:uncharacterized protein LOC114186106 isoform X2 [Vigna unguiculata]